jgi:hypothetical protein
MPHDKHGRLIEVGDVVKAHGLSARRAVVGTVSNITASQKCSGQILYPILGTMERDYFNADEAEIVLKKDGSEPAGVMRAADCDHARGEDVGQDGEAD